MRFSSCLLLVVSAALPTLSSPLLSRSITKHPPRPAFFVLAGDSTTTTQNSGGGGWGAGFLNDTLRAPASGKNCGHNGRTTVSFREGGDWALVLDSVEQHKDANEVFVTIQVSTLDTGQALRPVSLTYRFSSATTTKSQQPTSPSRSTQPILANS